MGLTKLQEFTNREYEYATPDDTFLARGFHLNDINDNLSLVIDAVDTLVAAGGSYTFENAITEAGGIVTLGGAMTQQTDITGAYQMNIGTTVSFVHSVNMRATNGIGLYVTGGAVGLSYVVGGTVRGLSFSAAGMVITDSVDSIGLVYASDYSTAGVGSDRWIPDYGAVKAYADAAGSVSVDNQANNRVLTSTAVTDTLNAEQYMTFDGTTLTLGNASAIAVDTLGESTGAAGVTINDEIYLPNITGSGTGTSIVLFNRSTGELTYGDAPSGGGMIYPAAGIALSTGSGWDGTSVVNNSANWNTAYGWGDHSGVYDTTGTASGLVGTHESNYNHAQYNTAYSHISLTNNPHSVDATDILPSQSGHTGEYLTTDGSVLSWGAGATGVTSVSGGTGIFSSGGATPTVYLTVDELAEKSGAVVGTDRLVGTTGTVNWAETISNIPLSIFSGGMDVASGGTGLSTIGVNYMLTGNGTSAMTAEANCQFNGSTLSVTGAITVTGEVTAYA